MNQIPSHDAFEDDLKAFLDGELPLFRRIQMRLHLSKCAHCAGELKTMQTISEELQTETAPPLEADLRAKILQNVPETPQSLGSAQATPFDDTLNRQSARKTSRHLFEAWGMAAVLVLFIGFTTLSIMGNRIKNTFNSAANAITTDGPSYDTSTAVSETSASAGAPSAGAPPAASPTLPQFYTANRDLLSKASSEVVPQQRAVHKQGSLTVAVDDAEAKGSAVEILVKNSGGFVANNALATAGDGRKTATLDVRVPVGSFESIVGKISKLGTVREKTINGEDVTQRVTAAAVQQKTLAKELSIREAQLRAMSSIIAARRQATTETRTIMAERQAVIADVRQLRIQAAQARAQLEYLRKYAALSNLYVTLQDKQKVVAPASFTGTLSETGRDAWASFVGAAKLPAQLIIWILAYSPLWIPALIVWRKWGRKLLSAG